MIFTPDRMVTILVVINVVGGASTFAAASVTPTPAALTPPIHATYILGLFLVNGVHGVMHLLIGSLGFVSIGKLRPEAYLTGHDLVRDAWHCRPRCSAGM